MKYGSVCSGVEAASLAWKDLGWKCVFVSEVEPFPCAVLQHRFGASAPVNPLDQNEIIITDEEWASIEVLKKQNKDWMKICDDTDLVSRFKDRKMRESWAKENALLNKEGDIPNEGDFTKIKDKYAEKIDLLVGGTPCQDLSVAGKRAGFDGERSSLAIDFVELAYQSKCKWVVWENVPGVFSSNEGRDFATFLSLLTGAEVTVPTDGWGTAGFVCNARRDRFGVSWRTLDGQFTRSTSFPYAVPQRRRRVFVVGYLGDWRRAAEVLLEPGRMHWDTPPRIKTRERVAQTAGTDSVVASGALRRFEKNSSAGCNGVDAYNQSVTGDVSMTLTSVSSDPHHIPCVTEDRAKNSFNFELYSGECKEHTPTLGYCRAGDTVVYDDDAKFWNGNDAAEALTCTSDRQLMPDKARLQCVIEPPPSSANGASFEINYGCPVEEELAHTLKCGTAPGTYNGVIERNDVAATLTTAMADKMGLENQHIDQGAPNFIIEQNKCFCGDGSEPGEIAPTLQACLEKQTNNQNPILCEVQPRENINDSKYYQWHSQNTHATPCFVTDPVCLNDQGGSVMSVESDGNAATLRANTHGNEQVVCGAFLGNQGAKAMGIGYSEEVAPTQRTNAEIDLVQTLKIRGGKDGGGKGALIQDNISATLGCGNDQTLFVVHGAQTPINNTEHANALGCCNDGLENCVCQVCSEVISLNNKQFGQCEEDLASTLLSTDYKEPQVVCYDNQTRARNPLPTGDAACTLQAHMGEGGNNVPLVQCYKADSLVEYPTAMITGDHDNRPTDLTNLVQESYAVDRRNQTIDNEVSNTLNTCSGGDNYNTVMQECFVKTGRAKSSDDCETYADTGIAPTVNCFDGGDKRANELVIENTCYAVDSVHSNSMKSANPHSGFHKEEIAKTLDTTDPNPTKNQGGNVIVSSVGLDGYNASLTGESSATLGVNCGMSTGRNGVVDAIAFEPGIAKRDGADSRFTDEFTGTLRSNAGDNQVAAVIAIDGDKMGKAERKGGSGLGISEKEVMYTQTAKDVHAVCTKGNGDGKDIIYGDAEKKRAYEVLFALWQRVGKSAFCKWASGRLGSIQETEILQQNLYGKSVRCETCEGKSIVDDSSLSCEETDPERFLFFLWKRFQLGHSSHRPELAEQFIGQLALCLSELSHKNSSRIASTVRRLLPIETERLMGFPDNHTRIPWKGLPAEQCPDSPRYKACGNSMCVNVMQWLGEQIQKVEDKYNV